MSARALVPFAACALALACAAPLAHAEWMQPDATWRDAQATLREAAHDTLDHAGDPRRLAALGQALLRVGRLPDATRILTRARALDPRDGATAAALGKLALFTGGADAESLLIAAGDADGAAADLYAAALRRDDFATAATRAEAAGDAGRVPLLQKLAEEPSFVTGGAGRATLFFERAFPAPLVHVKLNGRAVLMAVDSGAEELLLDPSAARLAGVALIEGRRTLAWDGAQVSARNGLVAKLDLGAVSIARVPAAVTSLASYSGVVNPQGARIAGVIGEPVLRRFGVTLDFAKQKLELSRTLDAAAAMGSRVPFERWGASAIVVRGSVGGGRRMAFLVATGLPGAGLGAPSEVFDELGLKPGRMSNLVRSAGAFLNGQPWAEVGVPAISVGSASQGRTNGWSGALEPAAMWRWGTRLDGLLGPEFFRDRRVTFDWAKHELVIAGDE